MNKCMLCKNKGYKWESKIYPIKTHDYFCQKCFFKYLLEVFRIKAK